MVNLTYSCFNTLVICFTRIIHSWIFWRNAWRGKYQILMCLKWCTLRWKQWRARNTKNSIRRYSWMFIWAPNVVFGSEHTAYESMSMYILIAGLIFVIKDMLWALSATMWPCFGKFVVTLLVNQNGTLTLVYSRIHAYSVLLSMFVYSKCYYKFF